MPDYILTIPLTAVEMAQLEKLATYEERDPAELFKSLAIGGMEAARDRRRVAETMANGRTRRTSGPRS